MSATSTVFSLSNAILLEPLPYAHADRLVSVGHAAPGLGLTQVGLSAAISSRCSGRKPAGIALGIIGALALGRVLTYSLFEV
ncbi:MAG TPA: hypothetical protein VMM35_13095, partial [Longimicrobiales bacterium]|nr:hypothetical protein [Longimicrobiales bacterium]